MFTQIMSKTLLKFRATTVVELRSRFAKKNFKTDLRRQVQRLKTTDGVDCKVLQFNAIPESLDAKHMRAKDMWGIPEPKKLRDITILSYFGQCCPKAGKINLF